MRRRARKKKKRKNRDKKKEFAYSSASKPSVDVLFGYGKGLEGGKQRNTGGGGNQFGEALS